MLLCSSILILKEAKKRKILQERAVEEKEDEKKQEKKERKRRNALDVKAKSFSLFNPTNDVVANLEHVPGDVLREKIFTLLSDESLLSVGSVSRRLYQATRGDISNRAEQRTSVKHAQALSGFVYFSGVADRLREGRGSDMDLMSMLHFYRRDVCLFKKCRYFLSKPLKELLNWHSSSNASKYKKMVESLVSKLCSKVESMSADNVLPLLTVWISVNASAAIMKQIRLRSDLALPPEWIPSNASDGLLECAFCGVWETFKLKEESWRLGIEKISRLHEFCVKHEVHKSIIDRLGVIDKVWRNEVSAEDAIQRVKDEIQRVKDELAKREVRKARVQELDPYLLKEPLFLAVEYWLDKGSEGVFDVLDRVNIVRKAFEYSSEVIWNLVMKKWRSYLDEFEIVYYSYYGSLKSDLLGELMIQEPRGYLQVCDALHEATISYLGVKMVKAAFLECHCRALEAFQKLGKRLFNGLNFSIEGYVRGSISLEALEAASEKRKAFLSRFAWLWIEMYGNDREKALKEKLELYEQDPHIEPITTNSRKGRGFAWFECNERLNNLHENFLYGECSQDEWKASMRRWRILQSDFGADADFVVSKVLVNYLVQKVESSSEYDKLLAMKDRGNRLIELGMIKTCSLEKLCNWAEKSVVEVVFGYSNSFTRDSTRRYVRGEGSEENMKKIAQKTSVIIQAKERLKNLCLSLIGKGAFGRNFLAFNRGKINEETWERQKCHSLHCLELPQNISTFFRVNDQFLHGVLSEEEWQGILERIGKLNGLRFEHDWPFFVREFYDSYLYGKMEESKFLEVMNRMGRYPKAPKGLEELHDSFLRLELSEKDWSEAIERSSRYPREKVPFELSNLLNDFLLGKQEENLLKQAIERASKYPRSNIPFEIRDLRNSYVFGKPEVTEQMLIDATDGTKK